MASAANFPPGSDAARLVRDAAHLGPTVGSLFQASAALYPDRLAVADQTRRLGYGELDRLVNAAAAALRAEGVAQGDVVAVVSENRHEYIVIELACAKIGAVIACQNWRQASAEMSHCISVVAPKILFVSDRFKGIASSLDSVTLLPIVFGEPFAAWIAPFHGAPCPGIEVDPESGLLILYTSGTTGLPKGAVISHRAMIARSLVMMAEWSIRKTDGSIAWSPLFHMAANDPAVCTLIQGGPLILVDGFDPEAICAALEEIPVGWLVLLPGMIDRMIDGLKTNRTSVKRVAAAGCMANLVPLDQIAEVSALLGAPFLNSFGSTETGILPASGTLLEPGSTPTTFSKLPTRFADIRIVDDDDQTVPIGSIGEICIRSQTLFSGYWNAPEATAHDFRNGWFHMGDDFVCHPDGRLDFVDRRKYLIKSGGENIYPAEIERVVMESDRVKEAIVVRQSDDAWGEVPVLFVVRSDETLAEDDIRSALDGRIARYKRPKHVYFIPDSWIERNVTGKVRRDLLEKKLAAGELAPVAS